MSSTPPLAEQARTALAAGADLVELRVDRIGDLSAVSAFLSSAPPLPVIVTIRRAEEGGAWRGSEAERLALLKQLIPPRDGYRDVELTAWSAFNAMNDGERAVGALIVSHHDLAGTPDDLEAVLQALDGSGADVIKAVFTPRDASDSLRILKAARRYASRRPTIALGMGPAGMATRVLARKFNGWLSFASLSVGSESAPGQPTIAELLELYGWGRINPATRVFGVIGWPVEHSRSPHVHNAAMAALGIDAVYLPLPVCPAYSDFARFMDLATGGEWLDAGGFSVTLPHKQHALTWLDEHGFAVTPLARRCGAVNTLTRTTTGWQGDNTDAEGALAALVGSAADSAGVLAGCSVSILGAGGAARGIAAALVEGGASVTIFNRTAQRAAELARAIGCAHGDWSDRAHCPARILINCTSIGMWPRIDESPLELPAGRNFDIVFDTVYNPAETRLLREARATGRRAVSGVEMFIAQAAAQFRIWHGREAPIEIMRQALID